jgi:hypothetical protein
MFPRGEVGIGVLLVSLEIFHQTGSLALPGIKESISLAALGLALNLCLTGVFILTVIRLCNASDAAKRSYGRAAARRSPLAKSG